MCTIAALYVSPSVFIGMRLIILLHLVILYSCHSTTPQGRPVDTAAARQEVGRVLDDYHRAATTADADAFFGAMSADGIYIGTDASERWLRDELREWASSAFERDTAWAFVPLSRDIVIGDEGEYAWFTETLDTWMGTCRSSGVLSREAQGWKIRQYHLAVTVPNDQIKSFIALQRQ